MSMEIRSRRLAVSALLAAGLVFAGCAETPELTVINRSETDVAIGPTIVIGGAQRGADPVMLPAPSWRAG